MKFLTVAFASICLMSMTATAFAGGAVAAQQQRKMQEQQMIQQQILQRQAIMQQQSQAQVGQPAGNQSDEVVEEVQIKDLWKSLETSSEAWALIIDPQAKVYTVAKYIELYRQKKVVIKKSPVEYAQIIDDMARNNPEMLKNPFERILMIVSIIEYDFDNGQDKDQMALQILGKQGFLTNKQRLGLK